MLSLKYKKVKVYKSSVFELNKKLYVRSEIIKKILFTNHHLMTVPAMSRMNDKEIVPTRPLRAKTLPYG